MYEVGVVMKNDMSRMMQKLSYVFNDKEMPDDLKHMLKEYVSSHSSNSEKHEEPKNNREANSTSNFGFPDFNEFTSSFQNENNSFGSEANGENSNPFSNIDMNTILKMKQIMENINQKKNDPRSNLLLSLKPYLKPSRKQKVDQYIQLFNVGSIMENFKSMGGEKTK